MFLEASCPLHIWQPPVSSTRQPPVLSIYDSLLSPVQGSLLSPVQGSLLSPVQGSLLSLKYLVASCPPYSWQPPDLFAPDSLLSSQYLAASCTPHVCSPMSTIYAPGGLLSSTCAHTSHIFCLYLAASCSDYHLPSLYLAVSSPQHIWPSFLQPLVIQVPASLRLFLHQLLFSLYIATLSFLYLAGFCSECDTKFVISWNKKPISRNFHVSQKSHFHETKLNDTKCYGLTKTGEIFFSDKSMTFCFMPVNLYDAYLPVWCLSTLTVSYNLYDVCSTFDVCLHGWRLIYCMISAFLCDSFSLV